MDPQTKLHSSLQKLTVPPEFARYEHIEEAAIILHLEKWRNRACDVLVELKAQLKGGEVVLDTLEGQGEVIAKVAVFDGTGDWVEESARGVARDILESFPDPDITLIERILTHHVKPIFRSNPHPSLNLATGRKQDRSAGGPMATQDYYDHQTWKAHPGAANLVSWCVRHIQSELYERVWHLVIPPVMTLLDDYEAGYKLRGIQIVTQLLERVPKDMLRRTGVDGLLFSSLKGTLNHLHNPQTPSLIRSAVPTMLSLILLTTSPGSSDRFNQLCSVLGESIIGGIWMYASRDQDAIEASLDVLPEVVRTLGIGSVRYLKALIPQLVHPLLSDSLEFVPNNVQYKILSLRALRLVIHECPLRIHRWKGTILGGVAKCWVVLIDSGINSNLDKELMQNLKNVCKELATACPSVVKDEYPRFLQMDAEMFSGLVA